MRISILRSTALHVSALTAATFFAGVSYGRTAVGEQATYQIDTASGRTVGLVEGGTFTMTIGQVVEATHSYQVKLDYKISISILGEQKGAQTLATPASYFDDDFITKLRASKHFESEQFKIDYLGSEDVTAPDGTVYTQADKIRIYDLKFDPQSPTYALVQSLVESTDFAAGPSPIPANTQLIADLVPGIPALGAVRIDLSGSEGPISLSVGADYIK